MGLAAPEQQAVRDHFDIRQDGRTAGGVAGHHLKKSIGKSGDGAVEHKRQTGNRGDQNPSEDGDEIAVFQI